MDSLTNTNNLPEKNGQEDAYKTAEKTIVQLTASRCFSTSPKG